MSELKKFDFLLGFFVDIAKNDIDKKNVENLLLRINEHDVTSVSVDGLYFHPGKGNRLSHVTYSGNQCMLYIPQERFGKIAYTHVNVELDSTLRDKLTVPLSALNSMGATEIKKRLQGAGLLPGIVNGKINAALQIALAKEDTVDGKGRIDGIITTITADNILRFYEQNHPSSTVLDFIREEDAAAGKNKKIDMPNSGKPVNPLLNLTPPEWGKKA